MAFGAEDTSACLNIGANESFDDLAGVDNDCSELFVVVKGNFGLSSCSIDVDLGVLFEVHLEEIGDERDWSALVEVRSSVASCQSSQHLMIMELTKLAGICGA